MSKKAVKPFLRADHKIWNCPPHTVGRQLRKKKGTDDYHSNHAYLLRKSGC
jgi:hypothetical protein